MTVINLRDKKPTIIKKIFLLTLIFLCITNLIFSQISQINGVPIIKRNTHVYTDTVYTTNDLKIEIEGTLAFRGNVKIPMFITNLSDNYKTIYSKDITITDINNKPIVVNVKKPLVIPPKTTKKYTVIAESESFKINDIKITINQIHSTSKIENIIKPDLISLKLKDGDIIKIGDLELNLIKCATSNLGLTKIYFKLSYTGTNLLAIEGFKIKLISESTKKIYTNFCEKSKLTSYPEGRESYTLLLEFDNPNLNFDTVNGDKISFENVFIEYKKTSENKPYELHIYKKGEISGDAPKEEKDKNTSED